MPSIDNLTYRFGSANNDRLMASGMDALLGMDGDDVLTGGGYETYLYGGVGNDRYIAEAYFNEIRDSGGSDTIVLDGDVDAYEAGWVDGEHLALYNDWTGSMTLLLNFKGAGYIEQFVAADGTALSGEEVTTMVNDQGYDFSYDDIADNFYYGTDGDELEKGWEIDGLPARMNWETFFNGLRSAGNTDASTVAQQIDQQAHELLSDDALGYWEQANGREVLTNSRFEGLEQNMASGSSAPAIEASYDQAENIALLYEGALDRQPDEGGLNYWVDEFEHGMALEEIAARFIDSDEFKSRFDVHSDGELVDQLYQNVLDRAPDSAGRAWWVNQLTSGARDQSDVLIGFSVSPESENNAAWLSGLQSDDAGHWTLVA